MIYAINKRTKEHKVVDSAYADYVGFDIDGLEESGDTVSLVEATPDGWIEWRSGECPLPDWHKVEVRLKNGGVSEAKAGDYMNRRWEERDFPFGEGIIAYRPILNADTKPEPPAWGGDGLPPVGCECEAKDDYSQWQRCRIAGVEGSQLWIDFYDDGYATSHIDDIDIRPIRSEEGRAVEEMVAIDPVGFTNRDSAVVRDFARELYRAGYRKTGDT